VKYFLDIYGALPRAGPGSNAATRKALELSPQLPAGARILDLGCGPGVQTVELLQHTSAKVVALDFLPEMIHRTNQLAAKAGVSQRMETLQQDMNDMDFADASFDVIWSEGAIYNLGFEAGLGKIKPFVKPGGYVAVSDAVWLKPNPPAEVVEFWKAYPEMDSVSARLEAMQRQGYERVDEFILPATAWTEQYYDPMEVLLTSKEAQWQGIAEAEAVLIEARREIEIFHRYSDWYSYAFFVMRPVIAAH
jgi:ubiquinone/menaquinone biosynthesis C-methylase UbiE